MSQAQIKNSWFQVVATTAMVTATLSGTSCSLSNSNSSTLRFEIASSGEIELNNYAKAIAAPFAEFMTEGSSSSSSYESSFVPPATIDGC